MDYKSTKCSSFEATKNLAKMVADMSMVANMSVVLCVLVQLLTCLSRNGLVSAESCINERELKLNILSSDYQCTGCILGTIEICENGKLRKFCDGDWTMEDATVACKTLGYSTEGTVLLAFKYII